MKMVPFGENERRHLLGVARRMIEGAMAGPWKPGEAAEKEPHLLGGQKQTGN